MNNPSWPIEDIQPIMSKIEAIAQRYGYKSLVYGSTIYTGTGRDLDIMLMPSNIFEAGRGKTLIDIITRELELSQGSNQLYLSPISGELSVILYDKHNRIIDLTITKESKEGPYYVGGII